MYSSCFWFCFFCVFVSVFRVYTWTDDHGRKLKCSAPLYFDYAMSYIQELLTDEDVFPTKAGKKNLTGALSTAALALWTLDFIYTFTRFPQVPPSQRVSSFSSRKCSCCFSELWPTFTGLTTEKPRRWACTRTSTRSSPT